MTALRVNYWELPEDAKRLWFPDIYLQSILWAACPPGGYLAWFVLEAGLPWSGTTT